MSDSYHSSLIQPERCPSCNSRMITSSHMEEEPLGDMVVVHVCVLSDCVNCATQVKTTYAERYQQIT